jgi:hypothetical protein
MAHSARTTLGHLARSSGGGLVIGAYTPGDAIEQHRHLSIQIVVTPILWT